MDWDKLRIFHVVSETGSLTLAGKNLGLSQSSISRHITSLEESLHTTLFHRHSRGLALTEQGEYLYRTTRDVVTKLSAAQTHLTHMQEGLAGPLTVTATHFFGSSWLAESVSDFIKENPQIQVNLKFDNEELDLSMREADIAIRMYQPTQMDVIQRHFVQFNFHLYASKNYLAKNAPLETIDDLKKHHIIAYTEDFLGPFQDDNWILRLSQIDPDTHLRLTKTTNLTASFKLALQDVGVTCLPDYLAAPHPDLIQLLPTIQRPAVDCYLCYPEEIKGHQRVKAFTKYIIERSKQTNF